MKLTIHGCIIIICYIYFSLLIFIIFFNSYQVEEKEEHVLAETKEGELIAEVDTGSSSDGEVVVGPKPHWVESELADYQEVEVGYPLPPPPPTTPPLPDPHSPTISELIKLEMYTFDHKSKSFVLVPQVEASAPAPTTPPPIHETKEDNVNDSLLSSVHYASSSDDVDEDEEEPSSSSLSIQPILYHSVVIRGRGNVAVFRSKRAPAHKLTYFTESGNAAYVKQKHLDSFEKVRFHELNDDGAQYSIDSPAHGCLHKSGGGCWCDNLSFYL